MLCPGCAGREPPDLLPVTHHDHVATIELVIVGLNVYSLAVDDKLVDGHVYLTSALLNEGANLVLPYYGRP